MKIGQTIVQGVVIAIAVSACWRSFGCVSVPKDQGIAKQVVASPGSTVDAIDGDEALIAAVAKKVEANISATDQSSNRQEGGFNAAFEPKNNAGGNINSDDWTSRILAIAALLGLSGYVTRHRMPPLRKALDYVGGRMRGSRYDS